jgi:hypothetical protein
MLVPFQYEIGTAICNVVPMSDLELEVSDRSFLNLAEGSHQSDTRP